MDKLDDVRRSMSLRRNNSAVILKTPDQSVKRTINALAPKQTVSVVLPSNPFQQLQPFSNNRSEVSTPTLHKSSRLSNFTPGLKIIRESRREGTNYDTNRSMTASSISNANGLPNKENDLLAVSTYIDSGSGFYK